MDDLRTAGASGGPALESNVLVLGRDILMVVATALLGAAVSDVACGAWS
jgi:hypothetical protein